MQIQILYTDTDTLLVYAVVCAIHEIKVRQDFD